MIRTNTACTSALVVAMVLWCQSAVHAQLLPPFAGERIVRVQVETEEQLEIVLANTHDVWSHFEGIGTMDIRVTAEQYAVLAATGMKLDVLIDDIPALMARQLPDVATAPQGGVAGDNFYESYHTLDEIITRLNALADAYPDLAEVISIGESVEGRDIYAIRMTSGGDGSSKPGFFFHGGIHAREWVSPATMMWITEWLLTNHGVDPLATSLMEQLEWTIVPVLNPDGYEYTFIDFPENRLWRKNRRLNGFNMQGNPIYGVDCNRNFGYEWGGAGSSGSPNNETYRGPEPFSEPETRAVRDYVLDNPNVVAYIDFHSYSELILWPWGYTNALSADEPAFDFMGKNMQFQIAQPYGHVYVAGPVNTTIYPVSGGSVDWVYGANLPDRNIAAISVELRDTGEFGFLLPPEQIIPTSIENLGGVLALAQAVVDPLWVDVIDPPSSIAPGQTVDVRSTVEVRSGTFASEQIVAMYRYDDQSDFNSVPMVPVAEGLYAGILPPGDCSGTLEYYVMATSDGGVSSTSPMFAPSSVLTSSVFIEVVELYDNLETETGWVVGAPDDDATAGIWVRGNPNGTSAQPADDFTPGQGNVNCYFTGQGQPGGQIGAADVDGGKTTLFTPVFSVATPSSVISYARWYSNDQGANPNTDQFEVDISNDGGQSWSTVEIVTENLNAWFVYSFTLASLGVEPSDNMVLRFVAADYPPGSIVEAAIDDLLIQRVGCPNVGDTDFDGAVGLGDIGIFSACLNGPDGLGVSAACGPLNADFDMNIDLNDFASISNLIAR